MKTVWLFASLGLIPPFLLAVTAAGTSAIEVRLVAIQLAASLATVLFVALTFAFDQASSIDLALTVVMLSLPGTLLFVLFEERWL